MSSAQEEARYWETRAHELQRRLDDLRDRWIALATILPAEAVELLRLPLEEARALAAEALDPSSTAANGLEDRHDFVPSDIETEMRLTWERLNRGGALNG